MKHFTLTPLALALNVMCSAHAQTDATGSATEQKSSLSQIIVTAPHMAAPLKVVTNPKAPRQPVPAHDGADYLKTIPGFSVIRKGGTDGDPVLRGMAGSRLNITVDGQHIMGGCGGRMDPPTAYIFPAEYDKITVIKGPQSVLYGPGSSAGTVLFERNTRRTTPGLRFDTSIMGGNFGRYDAVANARYSLSDWYVEGAGTRSHANDYTDGNGTPIHSSYTRWSSRAALGWTPDDHTLFEFSIAKSDGQAAYADRGMDGARFARDNFGLKFVKRNLSPTLRKLEAQVYRNNTDHVMDNYSLRSVAPGQMYRASNPHRTTQGGRLAATLRLTDATHVTTGVDLQHNDHTIRMGMGASPQTVSYRDAARITDARFRHTGLFAELTQDLGAEKNGRIITGWRTDFWRAQDTRRASAASDFVTSRRDTLGSGFTRYEHDVTNMPMTVYVGFGMAQRFPDYWELIAKQSATSGSAFGTQPETTKQFDIGTLYQSKALNLTASAFYNRINDYILIQSGITKGTMSNIVIARNVNATTWGGEIGATYTLHPHWTLDSSLHYVRGDNLSDNTPLAQMPPLESRLGVTYDNPIWSITAMARTVAAQKRFDLHKGNIAGQDVGASAGLTTFSINGGWKPRKDTLISAGIDNLTNKTYAEHLSRRSAPLSGYLQTSRINEPGRTFWLKAQFEMK